MNAAHLRRCLIFGSLALSAANMHSGAKAPVRE